MIAECVEIILHTVRPCLYLFSGIVETDKCDYSKAMNEIIVILSEGEHTEVQFTYQLELPLKLGI
jgi:hypothetical protein